MFKQNKSRAQIAGEKTGALVGGFLLRPKKKTRKKRLLAGLGGAFVAILAGAFVKDKERHQ